MKTLYEGHIGTMKIVLYTEVSYIKLYTKVLELIETSVLYREVSFIQSVLKFIRGSIVYIHFFPIIYLLAGRAAG